MAVALEALKGQSPRIAALRKQVAQLLARQTSARHLPAILILGETGTGKGLLARTFHDAGPRRDHRFVDINCAAIPETLLEAELFGYERGAFTDARQAKPGLVQTAHGGTLFLDEIGLLPGSLQSKLLTVLEDRSVRRLGSTRAEPVDVMLVAATSLDLRRAVADGRFREDLYHRVAVITLELPPLRTRGTDILILADHFLARACADYGLSPRPLTPDARAVLMAHRWPGNVRELANAMERAALLSDGDEITAAMLDFLTPDDAVAPPDTDSVADAGSLEDALRARVEAALRANGANIRRTAAALGISRNTLRARMDKYGLRQLDVLRPRALRPPPESAPPATALTSPQWERRLLSFLHVKLPASPTVDAGRALELIGEKVRTFAGRVEDTSPTGIIAVFGLEPVDNAPSHAALAALAIQNAAARAQTTGRAGAVVSAIHCAEHLVALHDSAAVIGVDGKGATWSILERMAAAVASGAIVVSGAVVPFLGGRFALERVQHGGLDAWLVLRVEKVAAGWSASRFVGRSAELDALRRAAAWTEQRHGQVIGVVGEAGVGKSRLVHEAVQPLEDWLVLSAAGMPFMKDTPFFPVVELLKSLCRIEDGNTAAEVRQRVARALPRDADGSIRAPILDVLRVLPPEDAFRHVDAGQRRTRTHDAVKQLFLALSRARPLCLIIEDLHWIDSETQQVLDNLINGITAARVLLLVNYRPEYQHHWSSKTNYGQVRLDALPVESASELLDVLLGPDVGLVPLKQRLVKRGNPFFLEETVRMLVETNALAGERGRYRLTHPIQEIQVPPTVHAMLAARIDRLAPEDRHLLQLASVIGKDIPLPLLESVAGLPDDGLRRGLERLQAGEFVYESRGVPELEYTFKHVLTHDVAYGSLLDDRRRALHAALVGAIERLYADRLDEHLEELAHHARCGDLPDAAVQYLRKAGERAAARSAHREAIALFEQALAALQSLPESPATLSEALDVHIGLGPCLGAAHGEGSVEKEGSYIAARELCLRLKDRPRLFPALWGLCHVSANQGRYQAARHLAEGLLELARELGDPVLLLEAHHSLWLTLYGIGDLENCEIHVREGLAQYDAQRHRVYASIYGGHDTGVCCLNFAALTAWMRGYPDQARRHSHEAVRLAGQLSQPFSTSLALYYAAMVHRERGEYAAAAANAEAALDTARAHGLQTDRFALLARLSREGPLEESEVARLHQSARLLPRWSNVFAFCLLAEAYARAGVPDRGLAALAEIPEDSLETVYSSEIHRCRGELMLSQGRAHGPEAENCFRTALDLARRGARRSLELRAATSLGRLLQRQGKREDARHLLAEIYFRFTEGLDTADLRGAKMLLDELSAASSEIR